MTAKPFVFSIRPVYLDMFRAGTKRRLRDGTPGAMAEFRRRGTSAKTGERHLIYETTPVSKAVAIATIGEIIEGTPDYIWDQTEGRGITRTKFREYFGSRDRAVAIEMTMTWLDVPLALTQCPPQSWARWKGPWPLPGMTDGEGG